MIKLTVNGGADYSAIPAARFDNPELFADFCAGAVGYHINRDETGWIGASRADTEKRALLGNAALVPMVDKMLNKFELGADFASTRWRTVDAVAGGAPNVAAFLSGSPVAMRRRVRVADTAAPLTIAFDMGVSQNVNAETIARRGAAALAFARLASAARPVELWVYFVAMDGRGKPAAMAVRIETAPLDIARAAWLFCAPEALRRAGFAALESIGQWGNDQNVRWLRGAEKHDVIAARAVEQLTGARDFVAIGGLVSNGDVNFGNDAAAIKWVRDMAAAHGAVSRAA
jgi:hypothetical protein